MQNAILQLNSCFLFHPYKLYIRVFSACSNFDNHLSYKLVSTEVDSLLKRKWKYTWKVPTINMANCHWRGTGECINKVSQTFWFSLYVFTSCDIRYLILSSLGLTFLSEQLFSWNLYAVVVSFPPYSHIHSCSTCMLCMHASIASVKLFFVEVSNLNWMSW